MSEVWKDVVGYEGRYQVSNLGRIKSLPNQQRKSEAILKQSKKAKGYMSVCLTDSYKGARRQKDFWVHGLVLQAFVGERGDGQECCHGDGDGSNNALSNLRWGSKKENAADKQKHGTMASGEKNGQAKLSKSEVVEIRKQIELGVAHAVIALGYGVSAGLISQIATNRAWRNI